MNHNILVSGSIAYDHLFNFDGKLTDSFTTKSTESISVSFASNSHHIAYGGCAANIAYALKLLGGSPFIFATLGNDFQRYQDWLKENGLPEDFIAIDESKTTAAAYIITDNNENQICLFDLGALTSTKNHSLLSNLNNYEFDLAIISPQNVETMILLAEKCVENEIPYIFDPGQQLPAMNQEQLIYFVKNSLGIIVNDYESDLLLSKTELALDDILEFVKFYIRTEGEKGCTLMESTINVNIPIVPNLDVKDVTGAGDAFRSGFLHGYLNNSSLEDCCKMGNVASSFAIEDVGTQNHKFTKEEFAERLDLLLE